MIKLEDRSLVLYVGDEGRRVLRQAGLSVSDTGGLTFDVQESAEQGLWVRIDYEDGQHLFLIRWDYILAIDLGGGEIRTEGLVH